MAFLSIGLVIVAKMIKPINKLNSLAENFYSTYDESYCLNESFSCRRHKHLPFQCDYNDNETLVSYAKRNYDFDNHEQIEEFVAFMGAYEITSMLKYIDDASYKSNFFCYTWILP